MVVSSPRKYYPHFHFRKTFSLIKAFDKSLLGILPQHCFLHKQPPQFDSLISAYKDILPFAELIRFSDLIFADMLD